MASEVKGMGRVYIHNRDVLAKKVTIQTKLSDYS